MNQLHMESSVVLMVQLTHGGIFLHARHPSCERETCVPEGADPRLPDIHPRHRTDFAAETAPSRGDDAATQSLHLVGLALPPKRKRRTLPAKEQRPDVQAALEEAKKACHSGGGTSYAVVSRSQRHWVFLDNSQEIR